MTVEVKLRTAAASNPTLQGYFGTTPFRFYPDQLDEGSGMPAATYQRISRVPISALGSPVGNMARYRIQVRVYDNSNVAAQNTRQISDALIQFINTFSATTGQQYANQLVDQQEIIERPEAQPPYFVQRMDFMIWNREDL